MRKKNLVKSGPRNASSLYVAWKVEMQQPKRDLFKTSLFRHIAWSLLAHLSAHPRRFFPPPWCVCDVQQRFCLRVKTAAVLTYLVSRPKDLVEWLWKHNRDIRQNKIYSTTEFSFPLLRNWKVSSI